MMEDTTTFLQGMDTTSSFKAAMIQFNIFNDRDTNVNKAKSIIDEMYKHLSENNEEKPLLIVLPEFFNNPDLSNKEFAEKDDCSGPALKMLSETAKKYSVFIFGGSVIEIDTTVSPPKYYNTCFVFDTTGQIVNRYRKIHLYDSSQMKESLCVSPGDKPCIVTVKEGINVGVGICFDSRFGHLPQYYASNKCSLVVYPIMFDPHSATEYLELLFRTRALDNYIYTIAVNSASAYTLGNSICCGPSGNVVSRMGESEEGFKITTIDLSKIKEKHDNIPVPSMRRTLKQ